jgi:hypothetical protein
MKNKTLKQGRVSAQKAIRLATGWVGILHKAITKERGRAKVTKTPFDAARIEKNLSRCS